MTTLREWCACAVALLHVSAAVSAPPPGEADFLDIRPDGGYRFGYSTGDAGAHFHSAVATPDNSVKGVFGYRDPTGKDLRTQYTAGKRGFRARGAHIHRHMDLSQNKIPYNPPVAPDSSQYNPSYSTYHDPNEDPSYSFGFRTPTHSRSEAANSRGDVTGRYSYVDDVGARHEVEYEAGAGVGFHVKTPYPDSTPLGPGVFFAGPPASKKGGKPLRGHTAIQRGKDGSYRFTAAGPDQRRVEESDATGHVRGSYTYLDDKGVQRTTQYIAGPDIGYKVINSHTNDRYPVYPYLPPYPPFVPSSKDEDLFNAAGSLDGNKRPSDDKTEDPWPGPDPFVSTTSTSSATSTTGKPAGNGFSDIFGPDTGTGGGTGNDEDDFGFDEPSSSKGAGPGTFLSQEPSSIPYGDCCKLALSRHSRKHHHDFPIRAHVQSIDLKPFGSRLPPPGAAIDMPDVGKTKRGESLSFDLEVPGPDGWGGKFRRQSGTGTPQEPPTQESGTTEQTSVETNTTDESSGSAGQRHEEVEDNAEQSDGLGEVNATLPEPGTDRYWQESGAPKFEQETEDTQRKWVPLERIEPSFT